MGTKLQKAVQPKVTSTLNHSQKTIMGGSRTQEVVEQQFTDKDKLGINNSIAAHIRWQKNIQSLSGRTPVHDRHMPNNSSSGVSSPSMS